MSRIGATIGGFERFFLTQLARVDAAALDNALRLSTGKRVNAPSDDPSAFLQISSFEQQLNVLSATRSQIDRAATVGAESQLALDGIRTQLNTIRDSLELDEDGSLTTDERATEQATIDAAIEAIADLADTRILDRRFLDGSSDYSFSGKDSAQIAGIEVYALGESSFSGTVSSAATQGTRTYTGSGGNTTSAATVTLTGKRGAATITVTSGEALTDVASRINQESHQTGITASVSGDDLDLTTVDYGTAATIDVEVTSGTFSTTGTGTGTDASVTINGQAVSSARTDGNRVQYISEGTNIVFDLRAGFSGAFSTVTVTDEEVAKFTLSTELTDVTSLAVRSVDPKRLGGVSGVLADLASGGSLSGLGSNTSQAIRVVDEALAQLTRAEGSVDAFADVAVASAGDLVDGFTETLEEGLEKFNGVDEDEESLLLAKNQSLGTNSLVALSLLQQQQSGVLSLIRSIAGL